MKRIKKLYESWRRYTIDLSFDWEETHGKPGVMLASVLFTLPFLVAGGLLSELLLDGVLDGGESVLIGGLIGWITVTAYYLLRGKI